MKYIEPPTKRRPKPLPPKKPKEYFWIRMVIGIMTIILLLVLSNLLK